MNLFKNHSCDAQTVELIENRLMRTGILKRDPNQAQIDQQRVDQGTQFEGQGKVKEAVRSYILGNDIDKACGLTEYFLKSVYEEMPAGKFIDFLEVADLIQSVNISKVKDDQVK